MTARWLCLLGVLGIVLLSCSHDSRVGLARVRRAGVLRWGGDIQGGEPYVYEDRRRPGHLVGFEVDLVAAIGRELHG